MSAERVGIDVAESQLVENGLAFVLLDARSDVKLTPLQRMERKWPTTMITEVVAGR